MNDITIWHMKTSLLMQYSNTHTTTRGRRRNWSSKTKFYWSIRSRRPCVNSIDTWRGWYHRTSSVLEMFHHTPQHIDRNRWSSRSKTVSVLNLLYYPNCLPVLRNMSSDILDSTPLQFQTQWQALKTALVVFSPPLRCPSLWPVLTKTSSPTTTSPAP